MKRLLRIVFLVGLAACRDDMQTPESPVDDLFDPTAPGVVLLRQGVMSGGGGHTVSGTATLYDDAGKLVLVFDPFSAQNGPDLWVYLSTDENATNYIRLAMLKSTMGKQSYEITGMPDLDEYKYALIWCEKFTVLFGTAELK